MLITDLAPLIKYHGIVEVKLHDIFISFDLRHRHERDYFLKCIMDIQYPLSDLDDMLFKALIHEGDFVLDAGANIGFTSINIINAGASKVVAIEPVPEIYNRLSAIKNSRINSINCAISSSVGTAELTLSSTHNQGSTISADMLITSPQIFSDNPTKISVPTRTIDDIIVEYGKFDIWKLDIEGAEVEALDGAIDALYNNCPRAIIAELYPLFLNPFRRKVKDVFPHAYKAFIKKSDYSLSLLPVDTQNPPEYHKTSPMYVFSKEKINIPNIQ